MNILVTGGAGFIEVILCIICYKAMKHIKLLISMH